jgi:hypothetical protein
VLGHLGSNHTVDYVRAGNTPQDPHNHWVVSKLIEDDGIPQNGGAVTHTFEYTNGVWDFIGMTLFLKFCYNFSINYSRSIFSLLFFLLSSLPQNAYSEDFKL